MRHDLHAINQEEEKLQREIKNMNKQNLHKNLKVIKENKIDTKIQNTGQLVTKMMGLKREGDRVPLH